MRADFIETYSIQRDRELVDVEMFPLVRNSRMRAILLKLTCAETCCGRWKISKAPLRQVVGARLLEAFKEQVDKSLKDQGIEDSVLVARETT